MFVSRVAVLLHATCCCCWCCCGWPGWGCCCCWCPGGPPCWGFMLGPAGLCEQWFPPPPWGDRLLATSRPPGPVTPVASFVPEHGFPSLTRTGTATRRGELCDWKDRKPKTKPRVRGQGKTFSRAVVRFAYLVLSILFGHCFLLGLPLAFVPMILKPNFHLKQAKKKKTLSLGQKLSSGGSHSLKTNVPNSLIASCFVWLSTSSH